MAYQCINYLDRVGDNAEKVFKEAAALRCRHVSTASWDQMRRAFIGEEYYTDVQKVVTRKMREKNG